MFRCLFAAWLAMLMLPASAETWIDVRSPAEYARGHVAGAINIPHDQVALRIGEVTRDLDTPIKVYCGIGVRAQMAKLQLESVGYKNVQNAGAYADIEANPSTSGAP